MLGRIVEVAEDRRHLSLHHGFLMVEENGGARQEIGRVPIDDIGAVIANAHGITYTNNLLVALAERGTPFVLCAANHNAVGMLWPMGGNFEMARRIEAQINAAKPVRKRAWGAIVRSKLEQQAATLDAAGKPSAPLSTLARKVKSGDPENLEAQGARRYWTLLFGPEFRRDQEAAGLNAMLNYGYTVLRAATARATIAAGLHPSIGLHHSHDNNAMRLVDDLMEPFRPIIDLKVWHLMQQAETEITAQSKRALVGTLYDDMQTDSGVTPVSVCLQRLTTSLAQVYLGQRDKVDLPLPGLPLALMAVFDAQ